MSSDVEATLQRLLLPCALAALAACNAERAEGPATDETQAAAGGRDQGPAKPGTYQVVRSDGSTGAVLLIEDGTYLQTFGDQSESGGWSNVGGKACFEPEGELAGERCYAIGAVAADGSFIATPDGGEPMTLTKLD